MSAEAIPKRLRRPKLSAAATLLTKKWKMAKPPELEQVSPKFNDCVQRWSIHHSVSEGEESPPSSPGSVSSSTKQG